MDNHISNRDLCYEGKHTFENVAHNFDVSEDTYQELRGKNLEKIKAYHDEVLQNLAQSVAEYKANTRGGDGYILVNKINPTVKHLNSINMKIINMLEETMNSINEIDLDMRGSKEHKTKFETKLNDINLEIEKTEKSIEDMSQNLKNNSKVTKRLSDENKMFFLINCVILAVVLIGCLYIIFGSKKSKKMGKNQQNILLASQSTQPQSRGPILTNEEKQSRNSVLSKLFDQNEKNTNILKSKDNKLSRKERRQLKKMEKERMKAIENKNIKTQKKGLFDFMKKKEEPSKME